MAWGVAQTESSRERTAARWLEAAGTNTWLPLIRAGARVEPLFRGYLFVELGGSWAAIENTIGVLKLLRSGERPAQLPVFELARLRAMERDGLVRLPKPRGLLIGDKIRVIRGLFADHLAVYDGQSSRDRVWILLEFLGQQTRAEIQRADFRTV
ncbi:MAG TPA: transcription termination/antitermination NusG family protein [Xanthobacteraceae bacterium]|jgi:transcriptional antiterminator RfaH